MNSRLFFGYPVRINTDWLIIIFLMILFYGFHLLSRIMLPYTVPYEFFVVTGGLIFQYKQLINEWEKVIYTSLAALGLSFIAFIPGRNETVYDFKEHFEFWLIVYIVAFAIVALQNKKFREMTVPTVSEGTVLLQSLAIIYWLLDMEINPRQHVFVFITFLLSIPFVIFSLYHAFSYSPLTRPVKVSLSIWSAFITIVFVFDYLLDLLHIRPQWNLSNEPDWLHFFKFFLLGMAVIYMVHAFVLLYDLIVSSDRRWVYSSAKDVVEMHARRFSGRQLPKNSAVLISIMTISFFVWNYYSHTFPANTAIWLVFILIPALTELARLIKKKLVASGNTPGKKNKSRAF